MVNLIVYVVSTLFTYVMGVVSKYFKWNEKIPIPVQNIIVGIICFSIAYIIYKPENSEALVEQIIVALGGSGTATLSYDLSKINKGDDK